MITNERQYKITRAEAEKFRQALKALDESHAERTDTHPRLLQAEREALESQLQDLLDEIQHYELLLDAEAPVIELESFSDLADGLIKARIASGLSQKDLADRLGMKAQQIQRYEAERFAGASLKRLNEIVAALNVRVSQDIFVPFKAEDIDGISKKIAQVGLSHDFLTSRLMSSQESTILLENLVLHGQSNDSIIGNVSSVLDRIFGWSPEQLFDRKPLPPPHLAAAEARFKMPAARDQKAASAYAAYAHYLALVVLNASRELEPKPIPVDPEMLHSAITDAYGELTLRTCLNYAWDLGVAVLPLNDAGTFHGACWRYYGRNVIVLKQRSRHLARWMFDFLHELYHAAQKPEQETFEVIEADETSIERRESDEEIMASQFAGEACLNGRAEELAQLAVKLSNGRIQQLKSVVAEVAKQENVDLGSFANYLAFRLSWQDINWWGAAANLQREDDDPWEVAREVFCERFSFAIEDTLDRELLKRALEKG